MAVREAIEAVMRAGLEHLRANEHGVREGLDPEYLHQMRVAVRRLRSALGVFSPPLPEAAVAPLATELKWLASRLGPARDWDVFMLETLPAARAQSRAPGTLDALAAHGSRFRASANAGARRAVRSPRYRRAVLSLQRWLAAWERRAGGEALRAPLAGHAAAVLEERYARVRRRGRGLDGLSARQRHRLRIAVKKFRYAADFLAGLYAGRPVREALKRLSRLQDILGAMNDAASAASLVSRACEGARGGRLRAARRELLGWRRRRKNALKRELRVAWRAFRSADKFW